jgi:hypothetical protein
MSIHSIYLVSDLEVSDDGDPLYGIILLPLAVIHGLVTVTVSTPGPVCVCVQYGTVTVRSSYKCKTTGTE